MIQLSSLTKAFGERVLLNQVTWQVSDRERVGLCGPNGAGKTTVLRMLAGFDEPDSGAIIKPAGTRVGYLPQDGLTHESQSLYEEASLAFQWLLDAKAEMQRLEDGLADPAVPVSAHDDMLHRYSHLQDQFRLHDGYAIDLKIDTVLRGLGFSPDDYKRPTREFSGGWQMRIALAKLLLEKPDLLLLDEPTNHLDLDARNWLEDYLHDYPHAVILVSHDRFFLDAVVDRITDINLRTLTDYPGNYSHYLAERDAMLDRLRESKRRQDEEVARVRMFIDRFRYTATKAAQVQSRIKALDKIVPIEVPPARKRVHFHFPTCEKSGRMVFDLKGVHKAYGPTQVFKGIDLHIERGDRIALLGPNGAGKSTLMRMLSGVEGPDAGERLAGHQVVVQYFAQDEAVRLDPDLNVFETLSSGSPLHMVPMIRDILGGFLFSGDDVYKRVGVLSGGERTRLAVARMLLRPSNTLLLDEPTNHLDLDSKDVLLDALMDYGGTLIVVSHDRYFIDKLATKVVEIGRGEALLYPGTYEEFHWSKTQAGKVPSLPDGLDGGRRPAPKAQAGPKPQAQQGGKPPVGAKPQTGARPAGGGPSPGPAAQSKGPQHAPSAKPGAPSQASGGRGQASQPDGARGWSPGDQRKSDGAADYEAKKRADAEARKRDRARKALLDRIAELEGRISSREARIKEIEAAMSAPGFYEDRDKSQPVIDEHQKLMWEVGDLMGQWEALQDHASE